jgi:Transposase DDE domain
VNDDQDNLQLSGMRVLRMLLPWRDRLDSAFGTSHGNANLELIDVLLVMLAAFYNPTVRSQRCIEAFSRQKQVREQIGVARVPRSTLSDALRRFDPEQLRPLIEQLVARVPGLGRRDADLERITRQIIAADGSYFQLMGEAAWALAANTRNEDGVLRHDQVRLNLQLDVQRFAPVDCDISGADDASEAKAFIRRLKSGVIYVVDRNFVNYAFINAVFERGSNLVLRLRKDNGFDVESTGALTDQDQACGVRCDQVGYLRGARSAGNADHRSFTAAPTKKLLRRVTIWDEKNQTHLVLLTDLLDVPAYVIGVIYRQRWQIELFFKWLKCWASFDHLLSHDPRGITLQFYVAVIATLLTHLTTGRRVSKYNLLYLGWVAQGLMSWLDMEAGLAVIEREKELERIRLQRKRDAASSRPTKTSR